MRKTIRRQNGLTLVEIMVAGVLLVAIALGASTFIPVGFKSNQRAKDIAVANQAVNKIMEEINGLDFSDVTPSPAPSPSEPSYPNAVIDTRNYVYPSQTVVVNGQTYPRKLVVQNRSYRLDMVVYKGKHNEMAALPDSDDPIRLATLPFTLKTMMAGFLNYVDAPAHATSAPDTCTIASPTASTAYTSENLTFTGTSSFTGSGVDYAWNYGDAQTGSGSSTTHSYASSGAKTVTLTVTKGSSSATCTKALTINQKIVTIAVTPSTTGYQNTTNFTFAATCTGCSAASPVYRWNFGPNEGAEQYGITQTHIFSTTGPKTVSVVVENETGGPSGTTNITVNSSTAAISVNPTSAQAAVGAPFSFTATCNDCGSSPTYLWNFGDFTTPGTTSSVTHTYTQPGSYTVSVTVTGGSNPSITQPVTVTSDYTAQLEISPGTTGTAGPVSSADTTEFTFTAKSSGYEAGTLPVTYTLNFGDGSPPEVLVDSTPGDTNFPTATHKYTVGGTYAVSLQSTDGTNTASVTKNIVAGSTVTLTAAGAATGSTDVTVGETVLLSAATLGVGSSPVYSWDFGDGSTLTGQSSAATSHTYTAQGAYTATVSVQGGSNPSATQTITVAPVNTSQAQSEMKKIFIKVSPWSDTPNKQYMTTIVFLKANNDEE